MEKKDQLAKETGGKDNKDKVKKAVSEPNLNGTQGAKHRHRRAKRNHRPKTPSKFGYDIVDLDSFFTKVSSNSKLPSPLFEFNSFFLPRRAGVFGESSQHSGCAFVPLGAVPDAGRDPGRAGLAPGYGRQRRLQERGLALRADAPRPGGLRRLHGLLAARYPATAERQARSLLGGHHRRLS